ncbi:uncharacterized protein LOC133548939 isoform X2 [Nerophis ophidion]|uniref:uncharacterized protein LOC133548939 isoform X2 n=1 Tax=Nerophis ophidion TaxID=159077 RepID=UPI002AE0AB4F|nr:uncharacterized protein LOC133548939 isoform X2 [Nerophis ophidion]
MDDNCYAKMATSRQKESERGSATEQKTKDEDVQQMIGHTQELFPEPLGEGSTLKQEHPRSPHIKEEEEELGITQEADLTKLSLTVVSVKTEDEDEKPKLDTLLAPLSDCEAEEEVEVTLSSDTDCEGRSCLDLRSKKQRGSRT